jgi:hypothetical protein
MVSAMLAGTAGHLYMQTNQRDNNLIHFARSADGALTEIGRRATGGAGAGSLNFRSNPMGLVAEGANSMVLTDDRRFLFVTNVGDNSVSSFAIGVEGELTLLDLKPSGNVVAGPLGTAKSLAFARSSRTLYVLHTNGADNIMNRTSQKCQVRMIFAQLRKA